MRLRRESTTRDAFARIWCRCRGQSPLDRGQRQKWTLLAFEPVLHSPLVNVLEVSSVLATDVEKGGLWVPLRLLKASMLDLWLPDHK
mmetsp:Transcript_30884/g.67771  ORF Transcript_30884/g.67771 Transcript_30884/m.67771 type:complete len:87 (+) Transcript_30884:1452-1712(+)